MDFCFYYKKSSVLFSFFGWFFSLIFGVLLFVYQINFLFAIVFIGMGIWFSISSLKNYFDKTVQLRFSKLGISIVQTIIRWDLITNTSFKTIGLASNRETFLIIETEEEKFEVLINELNTSEIELENIIRKFKN